MNKQFFIHSCYIVVRIIVQKNDTFCEFLKTFIFHDDTLNI